MNGTTKYLKILICCHEKACFSYLVLFESGFTIERVGRTVEKWQLEPHIQNEFEERSDSKTPQNRNHILEISGRFVKKKWYSAI